LINKKITSWLVISWSPGICDYYKKHVMLDDTFAN
jgi:hypothetical protein